MAKVATTVVAWAGGPVTRAVILPFLASRLMLLLVVWFSRRFPADPRYPVAGAAERGWGIIQKRIDVWARWDAGWYLDIAERGYWKVPQQGVESPAAFFPAYPKLLGALHAILPAAWQGKTALIVIGIVLSNAFFLAALILLYRLARREIGEGAAARSVLYLLAFPASFIFSCVYPESLFLFLCLGAFLFARRGLWWLAGLAGMVAAATRPTGVVLAPALFAMYGYQREWRLGRVRKDVLAQLLTPIGFGLVLWHGFLASGDWLAPLKAQGTWGRQLSWPWQTLIWPASPHPYMGPIDLAMLLGAVVLGLVALRRLPSAGYGIFTLLSTVPILLGGTLMSASRLVAPLFPGFMTLATWVRAERTGMVVICAFAVLQALLMAAWSRFYWVF
jgi:hypothetical protein